MKEHQFCGGKGGGPRDLQGSRGVWGRARRRVWERRGAPVGRGSVLLARPGLRPNDGRLSRREQAGGTAAFAGLAAHQGEEQGPGDSSWPPRDNTSEQESGRI